MTRAIKKYVPRTFRERWFSWPWHPFQLTKEITEWVPDPNLYSSNGIDYFGHPETIRNLKRELVKLEI